MEKTQREKMVQISAGAVQLAGSLILPERAVGLVAFAHGSGSSRFSPRNTFVARQLNQAGIGTLLMDLLTEDEDRRYETRFDIDLLTDRLLQVTDWLQKQPDTKDLALGYFGASTGAAAALKAAVRTSSIRAVVSRGGRPDLAEEALVKVQSPTLLIVGGNDQVVLQLNRAAFEQLPGEKEIVIVPGATHLFEEPGTLEEVARLATGWFKRHLHSVPVA